MIFVNVELDHHLFSDLPRRLPGAILQPIKAVLHLGDTAFEPSGEGLIGKRRAHDGRQYLMHIVEPLHRVGEGLFIDLGIFRADPVADTSDRQ